MMADEANIRELNMIDETTNVTDEMKDCKVSLKSSKKTIFSVVYTLNVPNFFILPECNATAYEVKSTSFEYANATWQFKFLEYKTDRLKWFKIFLLRLNCTNPKQFITSRIDLLDAYGKIYDSDCKAFILEERRTERLICWFNNKKPSYDRRDTLTLIIHLISDESFELHADQVPLLIKGDIETLSQDYKKLFLIGKNQDLTLKLTDKEFRVHQDILMARCQVFEAMLTHDMREKEKGVIDVSDCDPESMEQFLLYVYCGKVETLNQDNVLELYYVADKYQMMPLREACSEFIKQSLSASMVCDVILLALNHCDADLLESATQYFVDHIRQILPTVGWMSLMKSNMVAANELLTKATNKMADETNMLREMNMVNVTNVTDETNDNKVSLKSSKKTISALVCILNVPNFFVLSQYDGIEYKVISPSFEYGNATWHFKFQADMDYAENHTFDISLLRLNYTNPKQMISCTIDLLDADGERYDSGSDAFIANDQVGEERWYNICYFTNEEPSYDRRDTLTFIIHLISDGSYEVHADVETLSQDYKKLFLNGKNQDLTLKVADKEFRVHQDILMARCQVFDDMKGREKGVIDVSDCDHQAMEQFLFYVYSGKVETLNQDNALGLYYVADKFKMMPLKEDCSKFIKQSLSPSMICDVVRLALNHSDDDLLECATQYFVNHTSQIFPTVGWMSFLKSNMIAANELLIKAANKWDCSKSQI